LNKGTDINLKLNIEQE